MASPDPDATENDTFIWLSDGSLCKTDLHDQRYSRMGGRRSQRNDQDRRTEAEKDKDRIAYSGYLQRLAGITQVVSPHVGQPQLHSRLTHTYKVALVARAMAYDKLREARTNTSTRDLIVSLGGLDAAACEAAGLAHDLGHPPFGHEGETILRNWLSDSDSDAFEGNAQTTRIVMKLDARKVTTRGLDLTNVTLAAIAKYPWQRHPDNPSKNKKYSIYAADDPDGALLTAIESASSDKIAPGTQSLEASVMDLADDITYAMHDLQDFYQVGLINVDFVLDELNRITEHLDRQGPTDPVHAALEPSASHFQVAAVDLARKYPDYFTAADYREGLDSATRWLIQLKDRRFDGSLLSIAALRNTFSKKISEYMSDVKVSATPYWTGGPHLSVGRGTWHEMQILKHIARHYVVETPAVGLHQRAQSKALMTFLEGTREWVRCSDDSRQLPEPLRSYLVNTDLRDIKETFLRRAIVDYACSLSDEQCFRLAHIFAGNELPMVALSPGN